MKLLFERSNSKTSFSLKYYDGVILYFNYFIESWFHNSFLKCASYNLNRYSYKLHRSKSFGKLSKETWNLLQYWVTGNIFCYSIEFFACWKFNEFFWRECKKNFHCPNSSLDIFVMTRPNSLKVHSNESWINTLSTPQISFDFIGYYLNYWHLKKCHFFLPQVLSH
jgi:hypothetical protein